MNHSRLETAFARKIEVSLRHERRRARVSPDQRGSLLEERSLVRNDETLEVRTRQTRDVTRDAARVCVVERGVDLVEHKEGRWLEANFHNVRAEKKVSKAGKDPRVDGEQQRQRGHRLLSSG